MIPSVSCLLSFYCLIVLCIIIFPSTSTSFLAKGGLILASCVLFVQVCALLKILTSDKSAENVADYDAYNGF